MDCLQLFSLCMKIKYNNIVQIEVQVFISSMHVHVTQEKKVLIPTKYVHFCINPMSTTSLLTPFLIGPYLEMFTWEVNYDIKGFKSVKYTNLHMRPFFLTTSLIGSINDRIFILTNQQVVLMGLTKLEDIYSMFFSAIYIFLDLIMFHTMGSVKFTLILVEAEQYCPPL